MNAIAFSALIAICPASVLAQTKSDNLMTCHINTQCSAKGDCHAISEDVTFKATAKEVEHHGEGTYELSYHEIIAEARNVTMYGPWIWSEGHSDMQILSYGFGENTGSDSETLLVVWTATQFSPPMSSTVKFLTCGEG
jgi:hypothetical protein